MEIYSERDNGMFNELIFIKEDLQAIDHSNSRWKSFLINHYLRKTKKKFQKFLSKARLDIQSIKEFCSFYHQTILDISTTEYKKRDNLIYDAFTDHDVMILILENEGINYKIMINFASQLARPVTIYKKNLEGENRLTRVISEELNIFVEDKELSDIINRLIYEYIVAYLDTYKSS